VNQPGTGGEQARGQISQEANELGGEQARGQSGKGAKKPDTAVAKWLRSLLDGTRVKFSPVPSSSLFQFEYQ